MCIHLSPLSGSPITQAIGVRRTFHVRQRGRLVRSASARRAVSQDRVDAKADRSLRRVSDRLPDCACTTPFRGMPTNHLRREVTSNRSKLLVLAE